MRSAKSVGRTIGVLLLLNLACGLTLPFVLLRPRFTVAPDFLTQAASSPLQVRTAVLLSFAGGALVVALAVTAFPIFRRHSFAIALWFLAACVISCSLDAVHNATVMPLLSLSNAYMESGAGDPALFQGLGMVAASSRRWAHYTQLLGFGGWIFLFYLAMWRFRLIPRALAALGLIGIALQFAGVTLPAFAGYGSMMELAMPLGPIHVTVAIWLMIKGFPEEHRPEGDSDVA